MRKRAMGRPISLQTSAGERQRVARPKALASHPKETHMLVNVNTLRGYRLSGLDGTIGDVKECYFDDHH